MFVLEVQSDSYGMVRSCRQMELEGNIHCYVMRDRSLLGELEFL